MFLSTNEKTAAIDVVMSRMYVDMWYRIAYCGNGPQGLAIDKPDRVNKEDRLGFSVLRHNQIYQSVVSSTYAY